MTRRKKEDNGERLSVDDKTGVGDGGCGAAVADASGVACVACDDTSTDVLGLACRVPVVKGCTATDFGLCVACTEGFFTTPDECLACSTNTSTASTRQRP